MPHQEMGINRLSSHIQAIQLARETGLLIVKRGTGTALEEGRIVFVNGHITEVSVGQRVGAEALNWLSTWKQCLISFTLAAGEQRPISSPPQISTPQRIVTPQVALQAIEHKRLTRVHRQLFLLLDGQRSSTDVARLMGRAQYEVDGLLHDLEQAGLIQLPTRR